MKEEQVIRMMQIQYSARPFWLGCARFWRVADSILFLQKKNKYIPDEVKTK